MKSYPLWRSAFGKDKILYLTLNDCMYSNDTLQFLIKNIAWKRTVYSHKQCQKTGCSCVESWKLVLPLTTLCPWQDSTRRTGILFNQATETYTSHIEVFGVHAGSGFWFQLPTNGHPPGEQLKNLESYYPYRGVLGSWLQPIPIPTIVAFLEEKQTDEHHLPACLTLGLCFPHKQYFLNVQIPTENG